LNANTTETAVRVTALCGLMFVLYIKGRQLL